MMDLKISLLLWALIYYATGFAIAAVVLWAWSKGKSPRMAALASLFWPITGAIYLLRGIIYFATALIKNEW